VKAKYVGKHCIIEYEVQDTGHETLDKKVMPGVLRMVCQQFDRDLDTLNEIKNREADGPTSAKMIEIFCILKDAENAARKETTLSLMAQVMGLK